MNSYDVGNLVRVSVAFVNSAGAAVDPAVVECQVRRPDGAIASYTYGVDVEVVQAAAGEYYLDVDADSGGLWQYRWSSRGSGQAAAEDVFEVPLSLFPPLQ